MNGVHIQVGKRYVMRRKGEREIITCRKVAATEIMDTAAQPYLHVLVHVERASGELVQTGPSKLSLDPTETYRNAIDIDGARIAAWREERRAGFGGRRAELRRTSSEFTAYAGEAGPVHFNAPSELAFARKLGEAQLAWTYEPQLFVLDGGSFQPDFYLPALDLYVELTTAGPDAKRSKLDRMARQRPDIRVVALCGADLDDALLCDPLALDVLLESCREAERQRAQRKLAR